MGGLTSAVHWLEEWQLRVLVLGSLAVQFLLFIFASLRRFTVAWWVGSITWLAYLAGDAVAIYALATLFNRYKVADEGSVGRSSTLEVIWAPVLLIHLGGHDGITAYNIEDNELWGRHLLSAVSQVSVSIYVFCKSWPPGGDKRLLLAGILLFVPGVLKCFHKPWALKSASIYSLVSSPSIAKPKEDEMSSTLEEYVKQAKGFVDQDQGGRRRPRRKGHDNNLVDDVATPNSVEEGGQSSPSQSVWARNKEQPIKNIMNVVFSLKMRQQRMEERRLQNLQYLGKLADPEGIFASVDEEEDDIDHSHSQSQSCFRPQWPVTQLIKVRRALMRPLLVLGEASSKLFVDLSSPYPLRLRILKFFWGISEAKAYVYVQGGLNAAFLLLYTKLKTGGMVTQLGDLTAGGHYLEPCNIVKFCCRTLILLARVVLPWASIGLFHRSITTHRHSSNQEEEEAYNDIDVKITYAIFCCTAVLESCSYYPVFVAEIASWNFVLRSNERFFWKVWPETVSQYSLIGYFGVYSKWMSAVGPCLHCLDSVVQTMLCMKPWPRCFSSAIISRLVLQYLEDDGWKKQIHSPASYRRFNDHSTHWPLPLHLDRNQWRQHCSSSSNGRRRRVDVALSSSSSRSMRKRPFDECVLLWHIATDFCFFSAGSSFAEHTTCAFAKVPPPCEQIAEFGHILFPAAVATIKAVKKNCAWWPAASTSSSSPCSEESTACKAVLCRQMSNYMVHLLFVNPEMLLPGSRHNLFTTAHQELVGMFKGEKPPTEERELTQKIISKLIESTSQGSSQQYSFIREAWMLAQKLHNSGDEKKMWEEIQGVWVEMLCYSASRCRGYIHAKALGNGGEFLSYVWLLLFYMGMETFVDKLKREEAEEPPSHEAAGNDADTGPPSTTGAAGAASTSSEVHTGADASAAPLTTSEICMAQDDMV